MIAVVERPTLWQRLRPWLTGFDPALTFATGLLCLIGLASLKIR